MNRSATIFAIATMITGVAYGQAINREFTYSADLIGKGENQVIVIAIAGASMKKPLTWSVTIRDHSDHVLYAVTREDAWLDKHFGEAGFMDSCDTYDACKRRYYFEELPAHVGECLKEGTTARIAAPIYIQDSEDAARDYLVKKNVAPQDIEAALADLKSVLLNRQSRSLCVPYSPVLTEPPKVWLNSVGEFVPYVGHPPPNTLLKPAGVE